MNKIFQSLAIVLLVSFSLSPFLVAHAEAAENSWTTKTSMPNLRAVYGVAEVKGKVYVFVYDATYEYDPATDTWTTKTPMPTLRTSFGIATHENKLYVIGGNIAGSYSGWNITGLNEVYDPATDTWQTKTPMPTPRMRLDANTVNGKIYLIGGYDHTWPYYSLDENEVYDSITDTWTKKTSTPTATEGYVSAVVDNKIYVIGGRDYSLVHSLTQIYDAETDTWSYGAPMAADAAAAGATTGVMAPKRIYVIGGKRNLDPVNLNQVYDPEADTWTAGNSLPTPRYGLGVAVVNDVLYAIGGVINYPAYVTAVNEQYTPFGYGTVPPDTTSPAISIVSPENKTYTVNNVSLTFTVSEQASWIGYSLNGQANVTIAGDIILTGLSDGSHGLIVYAKDVAGNTGTSETIYFSIAQHSEPFPITWVAATTVIIAVAGAALLVYFRKIRKTTGEAEKQFVRE